MEAVRRLKKVLQNKSEPMPVFGCPLEDIVQRENSKLPVFFEKAITYLEEKGTDVQGIFRIPGSLYQVQNLKKQTDEGLVDFSKCTDVNVVAGLVKLYIRELPESLLTFDLYERWVVAQSLENRYDRLLAIKSLIDLLPTPNRVLLERLLGLLKKISNKSDITKMTDTNLAIVFGPTILRARATRGIVSDTKNGTPIVFTFLKHYEYFFLAGDFPELPPDQLVIADDELHDTLDQVVMADDDDLEHELDLYNTEVDENFFEENNNGENNRSITPPPTSVSSVITECTAEAMQELLRDSVGNALFGDDDSADSNFEMHNGDESERSSSFLDKNKRRAAVWHPVNLQDNQDGEEVEEIDAILKEATKNLEGNTSESYNKASNHSPNSPLQNIRNDDDKTQILFNIMKRLTEQRKKADRPDDLKKMTKGQLKAEKSAIKKELRFYDTFFVEKYGHEPKKSDKECMRQVYLRYRDAKALLSEAEKDVEDKEYGSTISEDLEKEEVSQKSPKRVENVDEIKLKWLKDEKRQLQILLNAYQKEFITKHGRKMQYVDDRAPIQKEYQRYKELKAQISALDSSNSK